jgi:hypothetical protein
MRQAVVGQLIPGRPRRDIRVELGTDLRILVERAEPDRDLVAFRPAPAEQRRAADAAEDLDRRALVRRVDAQKLLA